MSRFACVPAVELQCAICQHWIGLSVTLSELGIRLGLGKEFAWVPRRQEPSSWDSELSGRQLPRDVSITEDTAYMDHARFI